MRQAIHDNAQQHLAAVQYCVKTVYCVLCNKAHSIVAEDALHLIKPYIFG